MQKRADVRPTLLKLLKWDNADRLRQHFRNAWQCGTRHHARNLPRKHNSHGLAVRFGAESSASAVKVLHYRCRCQVSRTCVRYRHCCSSIA
jgi:hypothetical protein